MIERRSPATSKPYTLTQLSRVWRFARSSFYESKQRFKQNITQRRRGPLGAGSDEELIKEIKQVLDSSDFLGEGYRKVWLRLRLQGVRTSKERVRRLMREASLQASLPHQRRRGDRSHSGTICTNMPDMMWGTDATSCLTVEGNATIFVVVDHCTRECLGIHAASRGTRFEALEALHQAIHHSFGIFNQDVAKDQLSLRHDHGSQFVSHDYQNELKFLGIKSTPAYVAEPQCNGVSERFIRTLKEQLLWLRKFSSIQELNEALHRFKELFNSSWLVAKHNYLTPSQARAKLTQTPYPMEPLSVAS